MAGALLATCGCSAFVAPFAGNSRNICNVSNARCAFPLGGSGEAWRQGGRAGREFGLLRAASPCLGHSRQGARRPLSFWRNKIVLVIYPHVQAPVCCQEDERSLGRRT